MNPTKTAVIYRPFLGLEVKQDIDTMLYNANDLLLAYNKAKWEQKRMQDYLDNNSTQEYIEQLLLTIWENDNNAKKRVLETKRWKFGWTRMNQYLLVDFMMWLSVEFKQKAIEFIIEWANLAGKRNTIREWYKRMTQAIASLPNTTPTDYAAEATMINVLVSGSPASNQRARFTEEEMDMIDKLQTIDAGLIKAWLTRQQRKDILIKSL